MTAWAIALMVGDGFLALLGLKLLVPCGTLFGECVGAPRRLRSSTTPLAPRPPVAVLIPAHNEGETVLPTIRDVQGQLVPGDRAIVIADNCTDNTAELARSTGVTVIERQDPTLRGKAYALDFGLRHLANTEPPEVVVIVDADCAVQPGAIAALASGAAATGLPMQAAYSMARSGQGEPTMKESVSAFALRVKNWVRPLGTLRWGWPCPLLGSGMAFPWATVQAVSWASGSLTEDMQLGLDLTIAGYPPQFCPEARTIGQVPTREAAAKVQRTRWEHGHLQTLIAYVPRLMLLALRQGRWELAIAAADLSVPPLSLLVMLWLGSAIAAGILWAIGAAGWGAIVLGIDGILLLTAVLSAWWRFGRQELPAGRLLAIPFYVLWKIPVYLGFFQGKKTAWTRTERDDPSKS